MAQPQKTQKANSGTKKDAGKVNLGATVWTEERTRLWGGAWLCSNPSSTNMQAMWPWDGGEEEDEDDHRIYDELLSTDSTKSSVQQISTDALRKSRVVSFNFHSKPYEPSLY